MHPRRRTLVSLAAAATLGVSLTGCGGDDASSDSAGDAPASANPSETTSETAGETPGETSGGTAGQAAGSAEAAFLSRLEEGIGEEGSVHVRMRMTGPVETTAEGDTTYGADGSEMRMRMALPQMGDMRMELLVVDDATYMAMRGITPRGKYFAVPEKSPLMAGMAGGPGGMSPADSFDGFEAGLKKVEERGEAELGGETTERYRLHVDAARATEALEMGDVPGLPETLVYDIWLDEDDRMRRIVYEVAGTKVVMDATDWGKEVELTAPPKEDIVDAPPGI